MLPILRSLWDLQRCLRSTFANSSNRRGKTKRNWKEWTGDEAQSGKLRGIWEIPGNLKPGVELNFPEYRRRAGTALEAGPRAAVFHARW